MSKLDEIHNELEKLLGYECVIVKLETYNNDVDEFKKAIEEIKFQVERNDKQREGYFKQEAIILQADKGFEEVKTATKFLQHVPPMGMLYDLAEINLKAIRGT